MNTIFKRALFIP